MGNGERAMNAEKLTDSRLWFYLFMLSLSRSISYCESWICLCPPPTRKLSMWTMTLFMHEKGKIFWEGSKGICYFHFLYFWYVIKLSVKFAGRNQQSMDDAIESRTFCFSCIHHIFYSHFSTSVYARYTWYNGMCVVCFRGIFSSFWWTIFSCRWNIIINMMMICRRCWRTFHTRFHHSDECLGNSSLEKKAHPTTTHGYVTHSFSAPISSESK